MDVLRGNIVEINFVDARAVLDVVGHAGRSGYIVHLPVRMSFQINVRHRFPGQPVSVRFASALGVYFP